ncbi:MAG: GNAT family N-acetyltransferase [Alphaproteobacteria bacterium]|jgi:ribosomal protein S18 acetylase RimI-like enzyme|nr:GNAT family N-acetyltransferase [Alphaproteobacteria bacterium]QQS57554.1 MAG: GNAT family N-acetyltransferase [Alphaproteobacteria bacterium]
MNEKKNVKTLPPVLKVEHLNTLNRGDLNDLCDATNAAIESGGGFGWVRPPERDVLERYWQGVVTMPSRILFVARLDGVICGTCQLLKPPQNNEAQSFAVQLTTNFVAPWARGHGLAKMLLDEVEKYALEQGYAVINLDVRETMSAAISLYEKQGYTRIGFHPCYARAEGKILKGFYYYKVIDAKAVQQEP